MMNSNSSGSSPAQVVPATLLHGGRYQCQLTIPSSRFPRTAAVSIAEPETVASVERRLSRAYGEAVEVTEVEPVGPAQ
jgi:hypothetical protein